MKHSGRRFYLLAWVAVCSAVLAWTLVAVSYSSSATLRGETLLLGSGLLIMLTFPIGIVWWLVLGALAYAISLLGLSSEYLQLGMFVFAWGGFVVVGYLQWFMLLPRVIRKLRSIRTGHGCYRRPG